MARQFQITQVLDDDLHFEDNISIIDQNIRYYSGTAPAVNITDATIEVVNAIIKFSGKKSKLRL